MNLKLSNAVLVSKRLLMMIPWLAVWPIANVEGAALFPGPIPTLIDLYSQAELIVHADVAKTELKAGQQLSRLKVISVIKAGRRKVPNEIDVFIQFGSHWPRPFKANSRTITFLEFDKERKLYTPINSMTGLDVDQENLGKFYIKQFTKLPEILGEKAPRKRLLRKVEWYVELALFPPTRWNGAFGISVLWSRSLKAKLLTEEERRSKANLLTKAQKDAICRTLAKETPESKASSLVDILKDYPSRDLDHYLIHSIKRSMMFEKAVPVAGSDVSLKAFEYLSKRLGFGIPNELQAEYEDFRARRNFYIINFHNKSQTEYSEAERVKVHDELVNLWRDLATTYLAIPEVENAR